MNKANILELIKSRIGISSTIRDAYLNSIIDSVIKELTDEKGITLEPDNANHISFIVDYATWRYQSRDSSGSMPKHLHWRLRNLYIHNGGVSNV